MPLTTAELDRFHEFASSRIRAGDPPPSIEDCLNEWRAACDKDETLADIREALADFEAGRTCSVEEVLEGVRRLLAEPAAAR